MVQITEDYVSYETAKLLKEKGFDAKCNRYYNAQHEVARTVSDTFAMNFNDETLVRGLMMEGAYSIPTQQMAMRWLREEKEIVIVIKPYPNEDGFAYVYEIKRLIGRDDFITRKVQPENNRAGFDTYEDAVEASIKYCLTNLI